MIIQTIAIDCRLIREMQEEFNTSYRITQKSMKLKIDACVLRTLTSKKCNNLLKSTVKSVQEVYESDINS